MTVVFDFMILAGDPSSNMSPIIRFHRFCDSSFLRLQFPILRSVTKRSFLYHVSDRTILSILRFSFFTTIVTDSTILRKVPSCNKYSRGFLFDQLTTVCLQRFVQKVYLCIAFLFQWTQCRAAELAPGFVHIVATIVRIVESEES